MIQQEHTILPFLDLPSSKFLSVWTFLLMIAPSQDHLNPIAGQDFIDEYDSRLLLGPA